MKMRNKQKMKKKKKNLQLRGPAAQTTYLSQEKEEKVKGKLPLRRRLSHRRNKEHPSRRLQRKKHHQRTNLGELVFLFQTLRLNSFMRIPHLKPGELT